MKILALVVYRFDRSGQDRCLVDCLGPLLGELLESSGGERFWLERYDLRGPHLLALLALPELGFERTTALLQDRVRQWLADNPAEGGPSAQEVEQRHIGCRGRRMCAADALPGMADNDTCLIFEHPAEGYPFHHSSATASHDELWRRLAAVPRWAIGELAAARGKEPLSAALSWLAAVDRALDELAERDILETGSSERRTLDYWRFHASTLLPGAPLDKLETKLPELIGQHNLGLFGGAWRALAKAEDPVDGLPRMVELLTSGSDRLKPLREIDHSLLRQLGLAVVLQAPMVLFAWYRQLTEGSPS